MGVRHSRRKEVQPDPPVPPSTVIRALSMNIQGPLILARSDIHKTKAGSFKLSQRLSSELTYWRYRCALICSRESAARSTRSWGNQDRPTLYSAGIARSSQLTKLKAPCFSFVDAGERPHQRPGLKVFTYAAATF